MPRDALIYYRDGERDYELEELVNRCLGRLAVESAVVGVTVTLDTATRKGGEKSDDRRH